MTPKSRAFVSVKFDPVGRIHRFLLPEAGFDPPLEFGDDVLVTTDDRQDYATVVSGMQPPRLAPSPPASHRVVRRSTSEDDVRRRSRRRREAEARRVALLKIRERGLPMKLVRVEQELDESRLVFFFTADTRVDFRQLVRDLASALRSRIEMRQIGPRDEARLLGGYGTCGRPLCCTTWMQGFEPVSIKMAKRQHLSLNPSRLSGACGRLKCCLRYELPNAAGQTFGGCGHEGRCERAGAGGGCRSGTGGSCGDCAGCGTR